MTAADAFDLLIDVLRAPYDGWNWLADEVFLALRSLFLRFGVPIVFFSALAEATVGVGVVFPGVILMFLAGAYTAEDGGSLALVFVMALVGTVIGDAISYALGRWRSERLAAGRLGGMLRAGQDLVGGHGRWLIPFYNLHSVTRAVGPFGSGAMRVPLRVWVPLDALGAATSNLVWMGTGAVLGRAVLTERGTLEQHPALRIGLIALAVVWVALVQGALIRRRRREQAQAAAEASRIPDQASEP